MQSIYNRLVVLSLLFLIILSLVGYFSYLKIEQAQHILLEKSAYLLGKMVQNRIYNSIPDSLERLSPSRLDSVRQLLNHETKRTNEIVAIDLIDPKEHIIISSNLQQSKNFESNLFNDGKYGEYKIDIPSTKNGTVAIILTYTKSIHTAYPSLRILMNREKFNLSLGILSEYFIGILIIFGILFIISIYLVSRAYEVPFKSLNKALSKLNAEDYNFRVKYKRQDEFTETFASLNRTIEKVGYLKEGYKKAEKRINSLMQAVNESIIIIDSKRKITSINDAALNLFEINKREVSSWFSQMLSDNLELNRMISHALKQQTNIVEKKISIFLPDDREIYVKLNVESLGDDVLIHGVVLTFKDLKVISELENNLLRSMKFGVITNLASSISHEIKNPLSAMAMHTEIIKNKLDKLEFDEKNKAQKSLDTLQSEVKRINRIIQQFLTLARPSKLDLDLININKMISSILDLVQQQAQELKINISTKFQQTLDTIYGEEDQLKQVLLNLILNAFAAMDTGGKLTIKTKSENRKQFIEVSDTGVGIPDKIQPRIFDLYFTTKNEGGGIGLSISKNIMEAHEGKLYFQTVKGKGTTFIMEFPLKEQTTLYSTRKRKR
ncbi:PAS domain-containing sensor histidine kinase [Calditrichota bacterium]